MQIHATKQQNQNNKQHKPKNNKKATIVNNMASVLNYVENLEIDKAVALVRQQPGSIYQQDRLLLLSLAAAGGYLNLAKALLDNIPAIMARKLVHQEFLLAVENDNISVAELLLDRIKDATTDPEVMGAARFALQFNRVAMTTLFIEKIPAIFNQIDCDNDLRVAIEDYDAVALINLMLKQHEQHALPIDIAHLLLYAVKSERTLVIDALLDKVPGLQNDEKAAESLAYATLSENSLAMMSYVLNKMPAIKQNGKALIKAYKKATEQNKWELVNWLRSNAPLINLELQEIGHKLCVEALNPRTKDLITFGASLNYHMSVAAINNTTQSEEKNEVTGRSHSTYKM